MTKVNKFSRAGNGKLIACPKCGFEAPVYHFAWSALQCQKCKKMVDKFQWNIPKAVKRSTPKTKVSKKK